MNNFEIYDSQIVGHVLNCQSYRQHLILYHLKYFTIPLGGYLSPAGKSAPPTYGPVLKHYLQVFPDDKHVTPN